MLFTIWISIDPSMWISSISWCSTTQWFLALYLVENIPSLQFHHGVLTPIWAWKETWKVFDLRQSLMSNATIMWKNIVSLDMKLWHGTGGLKIVVGQKIFILLFCCCFVVFLSSPQIGASKSRRTSGIRNKVLILKHPKYYTGNLVSQSDGTRYIMDASKPNCYHRDRCVQGPRQPKQSRITGKSSQRNTI